MSKIIKQLLTLCLLFAISTSVNSQEDYIPEVIAPSPEAASLGKYIDQPVNYYTGLPSIEIPIYNISLKGLSLPISLSYHAGGLKVEDFATWVGAGWNLNAGGMVSRSIRGLPDEEVFGYFSNSVDTFFSENGEFEYISCESNQSKYCWGNYGDLLFASMGGLDLQPDLFYYSFPGGSGKFVHDRNGKLYKIPYKPIKITAPMLNGPWQIVTGDGITFNFKQIEGSYRENDRTGPMVDPCGRDVPIILGGITGWKLTSIISSDKKDTITLRYEPETYSYTTYPIETEYTAIVGHGMISQKHISTMTVGGGRLKEIKSTAGHKIVFVPGADREDLPGTKSLKSIEIYYGNDVNGYERIKSFEFATSYYGDKYLKLDSITEYDASGEYSLPPHRFQYNPMPEGFKRNTTARDHWGYYNGEISNENLIPSLETPDYILEGANREANSIYAQSGVLKTIYYPTGGNVEYEYELNSYSNFEWRNEQVLQTQKLALTQNGNLSSNTIQFTEATDVHFICYMPEIANPGPGNYAIAELRQISGGSNVISISDNINGDKKKYTIQPGEYILYLEMETSTGSDSLILSINWFNDGVNLVQEKKGGGLRVKKVVTKDGKPKTDDLIQTFKYENTNGVSSGRLMTFPKYWYIINWNNGYPVEGLGIVDACADITNSGKLLVRSSHSNATLGTVQGVSIGYSRVEVFEGISDRANGKIVYEYLNDQEYNSIVFPALPATSNMYKNGLPLKVTTYGLDKSGDLKKIKEIKDSYEFNEIKKIFGGAISPTIQTECVFCENKDFITASYYEISEKYYKTKSEERTFDSDTTKYLETVINYEYNDSLQIRKIVQIESNGDTVISLNYYPTDIKYSGQIVEKMKADYIINPVIEKQIYKILKDGRKGLAEAVIQKYEINPWNFPRKTSVYCLENKKLLNDIDTTFDGVKIKDDRFKPYVEFDYDLEGNIRSITKKFNSPCFYIWGYNYSLPIAQIEGANYDEIIQAISITMDEIQMLEGEELEVQLKNLIDNLPNARVHTYVYKPLIGIIKETDPNGKSIYYEYDNFGRVKCIRDDKSILKEMQYQYSDERQ